MQKGEIVSLNVPLSLNAAKLSHKLKLHDGRQRYFSHRQSLSCDRLDSKYTDFEKLNGG